MAGLLDFLNSEQGILGLGLLSAAAPQAGPRNTGAGLLQALQGVQQYRDANNRRRTDEEDRAMRQQMMQAQMGEISAQAQQRAAQAAAAQQAAARQQAFQSALRPTGAPTMANAAQGPDWNALSLQFPDQVELIKKLSEARNFGRDEVAARVEVAGPNGPETQRESRFGDVLGRNTPKPVEMKLANLGGSDMAYNPFALQAGQQFQRTQSPDSAASNAVAWANNALARQRLAMDQAAPKGQYDAERGLMIDPRSGVATPVTQGGQPIGGKQKDLTDAQSKALLFGERMKAADAIIGGAAEKGVNMPGLVRSAGNAVPGLIGAPVRAIGNVVQSQTEGNVEQAQRDFINAVLRRESGAVISPQEFENARQQYFYAPGDGPENIKQKAAARRRATELMLREVPAAHRGGVSQGGPAPSLDELLDRYGR